MSCRWQPHGGFLFPAHAYQTSSRFVRLRRVLMPLESPDHQYWRAAVGYVELEMFQEANDQLENIDPFNRAAPEVLAVRIVIYQGLKKWELMGQVAKRLAEFQPDDIRWTISLAYATRRTDSIQAAKEIHRTQNRSSQERRLSNTIFLAIAASWEKSYRLKTI